MCLVHFETPTSSTTASHLHPANVNEVNVCGSVHNSVAYRSSAVLLSKYWCEQLYSLADISCCTKCITLSPDAPHDVLLEVFDRYCNTALLQYMNSVQGNGESPVFKCYIKYPPPHKSFVQVIVGEHETTPPPACVLNDFIQYLVALLCLAESIGPAKIYVLSSWRVPVYCKA